MPLPLRYASVLWSLFLLVAGLMLLSEFSLRIPAGPEPGDVVLLLPAIGVLAASGVTVRRAVHGGRRARGVLDVLAALSLPLIAVTVVLTIDAHGPRPVVDLTIALLPPAAQVLMHLPSVRPAYGRGRAVRTARRDAAP
ncbi:hypothetical protein PUR61_19520 [Streptomyces sp. BE20]|uniref:hypothetical protein n=1 Tax=Streptomyces sp. BE303 TaxID=3002528 RepID=UPI002E79C2EC|nr:MULTISPECIES: hypothetical protein [unclassified Streptomyces]MED7950463.1 hypothetical protein [Streptomyces sp. BE303]MEE1824347.1 hypothetical protein [Streptomyces sp. BE20]